MVMHTQYYLVRMSIQPEVIGVKDGGSQVEIDREGFEDKEMFDKIMEYWGSKYSWKTVGKHDGANVKLQCVKAYKDTLITSFLSYDPYLIGCPFLISREVAEVLKLFNLPKYYLYEATVYSQSEKLDYFLFSCSSFGYSVVDFSKSVFFEGSFGFAKKHMKFENIEELETYSDNAAKLVNVEKICMNGSFDRTLDFFIVAGVKLFISERLKRELEKKGLNGLFYLPAFGENRNWPIVSTD